VDGLQNDPEWMVDGEPSDFTSPKRDT
jgi:hypothetical protein